MPSDTELQLELYIDGAWKSVATILPQGDTSRGEGCPTEVAYDLDYAAEHFSALHARALSVRFPVAYEPLLLPQWPSFLLDLFPQGAALRFIEQFYKIRDSRENYWQILCSVPLSPPGNLRTKSFEEIKDSHKGFSREEVLAKGEDFLEHMISSGAPVSGTSGVQGAAPKFLLREDESGRFHADRALSDSRTKRCWLVKFPRGKKDIDSQILYAEKHYLDIAKMLGLWVAEPALVEQDCLFVPRFDRVKHDDSMEYYALESLYSACGITIFGSHQTHEEYLSAIARYSSTPVADLIEYIKRDILNEMMGNTDNHGRNTAFLKSPSSTRLSPLYDFAPMKFDPEGITRATRWKTVGPDLRGVEDYLEQLAPGTAEIFRATCTELHERAQDIEDMMNACGISPFFIEGTRETRKREINKLKEYTKR